MPTTNTGGGLSGEIARGFARRHAGAALASPCCSPTASTTDSGPEKSGMGSADTD